MSHLPQESTSAATKTESQLVTFQLGNEEFGFDIMSVQEIIRPPKLARIPRTPAYVDGVANLRGVVLPVVDTRTRFGMPRVDDTDRTRVLVVDIQGTKTGLRVDQVRQVTRVAHADIEPPPDAIKGASTRFLDGVVKLDHGKRIIMALRPTEVCEIKLDARESALPGEGQVPSVAAGSTPGSVARDGDVIEQLVTFKLAREEFAFPIEKVREILRVETPKEVPDTPAYLLGILTVRGRVLPIIDLRCLLQQATLADEWIARCQAIRAGYVAWAGRVASPTADPTDCRADAHALESLRLWIQQISSSNQGVMETLSRVRTLNDRVVRSLQTLSTLRSHPPDYASSVDQDLRPLTSAVAAQLETLETRLREHVKDDQRIIVVEADGTLLGLVVDHVNEVLSIPRSCIDAPPAITHTEGLQLSGIAKLGKGERLIMLLDAARILSDGARRSLDRLDVTSDCQTPVGADSAAQNPTTQNSDELQFVTFLLGNEEYGIRISQIQEIDRCAQITKVPKAAHFVEGVTNLRGEVIPVIDTRKRFDLPTLPVDDRTRVIIVDLSGIKTGLLVDSVREVLNIDRKEIAPPPAAVNASVDQQFISGIGKVDGGKRMIVLLDIERILSRQEQQDLDRFTGPAPR